MKAWIMVFTAAALVACGSSDDGGAGGGSGGSAGSSGAAGSGGGSTGGAECGDYGHACMYGGKCHDTPNGQQDICEQQQGSWLAGNCPRAQSVGCCISAVPGTTATLIDYFYAPNSTEDAQLQCTGETFHAP